MTTVTLSYPPFSRAVRTSSEVGGVDGLRGQEALDRGVVDHVGQAVAAQQEAVAQLALEPVEVGLVVVPAEHDAQQERAVRVHTRLLGRQLALLHEALHEGVVGADLGELAVAQQVRAGVADVGGGEAFAVPQHGLERGAHALDRGVVLHQLAEPVVGVGDGLLEGLERVDVGQLAVELADDVHGLRGGEVAGRCATHAVGDGD